MQTRAQNCGSLCAGRLVNTAASAIGALAIALAAGAATAAPQFETIFAFTNNADGRDPSGDLAIGRRGEIYGTTVRGGAVCPDASYTCGGTVYRLRPPATPGGPWRHNVLHSFAGGGGGASPYAGVIWGKDRVLSGTTTYGGVVPCRYSTTRGCGTIFQLSAPAPGESRWTKQVLHRFGGERDGRFPETPLGRRADGTLFGTTTEGGSSANNGTAFTVSFPAGASGPAVYANLEAHGISEAAAAAEADYGIIIRFVGTNKGRRPEKPEDCEEGHVYNPDPEIQACECEHSLDDEEYCCPPDTTDPVDCDIPAKPLTIGPLRRAAPALDGSLYGVTQTGGDDDCVFTALGCGTVYRLRPPAAPGDPWRQSVIYSFLGGSDGAFPLEGLTIGFDGTLYGTTGQGGVLCPNDPARGCGVVFQLVPPAVSSGAWAERVLYRFKGGRDGAQPIGQLALDGDGALYGATREGGGCAVDPDDGCGTIFKLTPPTPPDTAWRRTILHRFQNVGDGRSPNGSVVLGAGNIVYGITTATVFKITP